MLKIDVSNVDIRKEDLMSYEKCVLDAYQSLLNKSGKGSEFTGWINLPENYDKEEFLRIKKTAEKIKRDSDVLIVIGIGGSYLGARAVIEFLKSPNYNLKNKDTPDIFFVGNTLSGNYYNEIIEILGDRDFSVNVISKSGTTTEPAIAFRIFRQLLEKKYGDACKDRIYVTTDKSRGALLTQAIKYGYERFVIPDDVGGRYSVLTAVGLLPIACAGIDIDKLIAGAHKQMKLLPDMQNPAFLYAAVRNELYKRGKTTEILASFEPSFKYMSEWFKQLFGESEGKDHKGIFPVSMEFTADLHSLGQYIQDGVRNIFETVVFFDNPMSDLEVYDCMDDSDGIQYLEGKKLSYINDMAREGTLRAHVDGGVPNIKIELTNMDEEDLGRLIYFFELSCAVSGYLLGVNPFDQPGVEAYKKNMFKLLGKPC